MKVQFKVGARVIVEAEGETSKQVFERVAGLAGVFGCADKCGACGSAEVVPQVREPQGYVYYEMACLACGARLTYGQNKEGGGLFPKRKDASGNLLANKGWEVYKGSDRSHPLPPVARGRAPSGPGEEIPY